MYAQLFAAVALMGSANALVAKPRQSACTQFSGNITGAIQQAQSQITILEQTLKQNTTVTWVAAKNVDAALDAVYLSISTDKDEGNVCNFKPKSASGQADDTWANRDIVIQLLAQVSSKLQTVQQDVNNCNHTAALGNFCALERLWINGDGADLTGVTTTNTGSGSKTNGTSGAVPFKSTMPSTTNDGRGSSVAPSSPSSAPAGSSGTGSQVSGNGSPAASSHPSGSPAVVLPSLGAANQVAGASCGKFAPNATAMIQKAQTNANRVLQDLAQNVTSGNGIPEVVAFMNSFNDVFNGVLPGHNMSAACNVTVPTIEEAEAAAKAAKIQATYELRGAEEQAYQLQVLFPLQKVAQDVASCDQAAAISDYCKIAQWYYQAQSKPSSTASAKPSSTESAKPLLTASAH